MKLDENGCLTEIDWKATRRAALALKAYIDAAPSGEALKHEYHKRVMPLVEATPDGSIQIPYRGDEPYSYRYIMEGLYPELVPEFSKRCSLFLCMIEGYPSQFSLSKHESGEYISLKYRVEKDGELYEWCWFED